MTRYIDARTGKVADLYDCPEHYFILQNQPNAQVDLEEGAISIHLAIEYNKPEDGFRILEDE